MKNPGRFEFSKQNQKSRAITRILQGGFFLTRKPHRGSTFGCIRSGFAVAALIVAFAAFQHLSGVKAEGGPAQPAGSPFRVLAPIASGNLLLFPVVREDGKPVGETPFITLDEGLKSGEVEVTEAGRARGLVRPRSGVVGVAPYNNGQDINHPRPQVVEPEEDLTGGAEVNTLVLVNHSKRPLLLLAGEIVTGGKQDRIVAKDRIVPAGSDPIDLSVFCIEPGRWTESSSTFGGSSKSSTHSFMVQPTVRERAMAGQDQQQVWDSVHGAISQMEVAAAPSASSASAGRGYYPSAIGTTSYAKVMQSEAVSAKVDEAAAPVMQAREQVLAKLRDEHAIGVVVAVRGDIIWADLFANTNLLARYWTKLVRSYAAESLTVGADRAAPSVADAQHFLDAPTSGSETSDSEVGVYRYRELTSGRTETFVLESLLPGTGYDVHISKMKLREVAWRAPKPHFVHPEPMIRPEVPVLPVEPEINR